MFMKRKLQDLFQELKQSSKLTKISFICILCAVMVFLISATIAGRIEGDLHSLMVLIADSSFLLLSSSFFIFVFLTGYKKDLAFFYVLAIPVSILFLLLSTVSIAAHIRTYNTFDFSVLGLYFCIFLSAIAIHNLGILVRMIRYKTERKRMWLRILIIGVSALLIPVTLILTMLSSLGGGFSMN